MHYFHGRDPAREVPGRRRNVPVVALDIARQLRPGSDLQPLVLLQHLHQRIVGRRSIV